MPTHDPYQDFYEAMLPRHPVPDFIQPRVGKIKGMTAFGNEKIVLCHPMRSENLHGYHAGGYKFEAYKIIRREDGRHIGEVELEMRTIRGVDTPVAIHDFYVAPAYRGQGHARDVVALLCAMRPEKPFTIVEIIDSSVSFWNKLGIERQFDGNGTTNWHTLYDAALQPERKRPVLG